MGLPGDTVEIGIYFEGDGSAIGAEMSLGFSNTKLFIDDPVGPLPGGSGGSCAWNGADTIVAIILSNTNTPYPNTPTLICTIDVRILPSALPGDTNLSPQNVQCVSSGKLCSVSGGTVTVLESGSLIGGGSGSSAPVPESTSLEIQLETSELARAVVEASRDGDSEDWGLDAFEEVEPIAVRRTRAGATIAIEQERALSRPSSPDAVLDRYVVAEFASIEDRDDAFGLLSSDPSVLSLVVDEHMAFHAVPGAPRRGVRPKAVGGGDVQPHRPILGIDEAWLMARGWGLVGIVDNGIDPDHPELRSFDGSQSNSGTRIGGGNYLPFLSKNVGNRCVDASVPCLQANDLREDQDQPFLASEPGNEELCFPPGTLSGEMDYPNTGHGSHVAGLVGANSEDSAGVSGVCANCGLALRKVTFLFCNSGSETIGLTFSTATVSRGFNELMESGAQVANFSGGIAHFTCPPSGPQPLLCTTMSNAEALDVILVASSGNNLTDIQSPARDKRVVAVGGVTNQKVFWDQNPNECPNPSSDDECGSNFRQSELSPYPQEVVLPAKEVWSTFPSEADWSGHTTVVPPPRVNQCGDMYGGPGTATDGFGPCTGTSMSAPQMAGILGLLRSINPLMPRGNPFFPSGNEFAREAPGSLTFGINAYGVRDLVAQTTGRGLQGIFTNDLKLGFGIPNTPAAVSKMLGRSRGAPVLNRVTPLFRLYSSTSTDSDYAAVATPQMAMALSYYHEGLYQSVPDSGDTSWTPGGSVPGYAQFPKQGDAARVPRAIAMILTTHVRPDATFPPLVPLHLMELPVDSGTSDFVVVSSDAMLQEGADEGYRYLGQQGYVYQWCEGVGCNQPLGTEALHLKCSASDCAVFRESESGAFAGFTQLFPGAARSQLGFAYTLIDGETPNGDGLVDAMERLIGTSFSHADSDGDGVSDANEYPLATAPYSDPCEGPVDNCVRPEFYVFEDGFE